MLCPTNVDYSSAIPKPFPDTERKSSILPLIQKYPSDCLKKQQHLSQEAASPVVPWKCGLLFENFQNHFFGFFDMVLECKEMGFPFTIFKRKEDCQNFWHDSKMQGNCSANPVLQQNARIFDMIQHRKEIVVLIQFFMKKLKNKQNHLFFLSTVSFFFVN